MVVGEINTDYLKEEIVTLDNRLKSNLIKYRFVGLDEMQFEIINIDISKYNSIQEIIESIKLKNNIYKIILTGTRNVDVEQLKQSIITISENICEIKDETKLDYNYEQIANEKTLKGVFTKNMLQLIKENPEKEEMIIKAIEYMFNS